MATLSWEDRDRPRTSEGSLDVLKQELKQLNCLAILKDDDGRIVGGVERIVRGGRAKFVWWIDEKQRATKDDGT